MPAYRSTDSHPYKQNFMPFPHYYQPQMNVDPSKPPSAYEQTFPYISGHGYPTPMQFCCGHHRFPGYWTYTPAYPSPMCFSGGYPTYPEPFYVAYAPPPPYTMELPRYEYDKCMPREHHCCGCPSHPLSHEEGKVVKIEEHEPDAEQKVNHVVDPNQLKNYPFSWILPHYMGNKELKKPDIAEVGDQHNRMPSGCAKADGPEPQVWNGWFPFDINSLGNMIQDGNQRGNKNGKIDDVMRKSDDGNMKQRQQSGRNGREFALPVIWIPSYNMQEGDNTKDQEGASSLNSIQDVPYALNSAPVVSCSSDHVSNTSNTNGNASTMGGSDDRKETDEKGIPVKKMEPQRSDSESHERRVRDIPVKQTEGNMVSKEFQTSPKTQSGSPNKKYKLPLVCLRVDPLPTKKNGSGSSRSPSPSKTHSPTSANGTSKVSALSSAHDKVAADARLPNASNVSEDLKPKERTTKVVELSGERNEGDGFDNHDIAQADLKLQNDSNIVEDIKPKNRCIKVVEKSTEKKHENQTNGSQSQVTPFMTTEIHENNYPSKTTEESWANEEKTNKNEARRKVNDVIKEEAIEAADARDTKERKILSDTEAAVLIQAAYRGFQERKWEPLKKLKQIAEVSKHVTDVRGSILALNASSNNQIDERERVTIGETIMRLLLKLDTIQGLHPSFREMRKSLARELTFLQEKLDSVITKKSQQHMEDSSEGITRESHGLSGQPSEEIAVSEKDSSDRIIHASQVMMEQCQDQLLIKDGDPSHDEEKLQSVVHSLPVDDGKCRSSSPIYQIFNEKPEPLSEEAVKKAINKLSADEASGCDICEVQPKTKSELEDIPTQADELGMKVGEELPQGVVDDLEADNIDCRKAINKLSADEASGCDICEVQPKIKSELEDYPTQADELGMKVGEELLQGVIDDLEADNIDFRKNKENEIDREELQLSTVTAVDLHEMEELPIGLFDDPTDSEKREEAETPAQVLQTNEGRGNPALILAGDVSKETRLDQLQQQWEEQEDEQSNGESDDWVKVEYEQDGFKGDALENAEVESGSREENDEQSLATAFIGHDGHAVANKDACSEAKEASVIKTSGEEVAVEEAQSEQVIKVDAGNREVLSEKTGEPSVTLPLTKEIPFSKQDGEMDTNKEFIEETEMLKRMMQKLLEAGNKQLTVISNLTGRVKDLEKKLARKKRARTIHCRPPTSKLSFKKSSNSPLQGRITGVAM